MVGGKAGGLWLKRQRMRMMASTRMVAPTDLWMAITWPASPRGSVSAYQASVNCTTTSRAISQCSSCAVRVYFSITGLFTCTPPLLLASGFVLRQQVREPVIPRNQCRKRERGIGGAGIGRDEQPHAVDALRLQPPFAAGRDARGARQPAQRRLAVQPQEPRPEALHFLEQHFRASAKLGGAEILFHGTGALDHIREADAPALKQRLHGGDARLDRRGQ